MVKDVKVRLLWLKKYSISEKNITWPMKLPKSVTIMNCIVFCRIEFACFCRHLEQEGHECFGKSNYVSSLWTHYIFLSFNWHKLNQRTLSFRILSKYITKDLLSLHYCQLASHKNQTLSRHQLKEPKCWCSPLEFLECCNAHKANFSWVCQKIFATFN